MKKIIFIAFAVISMSAFLVSCGSDATKNETKDTTKTEVTEVKTSENNESTETATSDDTKEHVYKCSKCKDDKTFKKGEKCCDAEMIPVTE